MSSPQSTNIPTGEYTIHKGYLYWQVRNAANEIVSFTISEEVAEAVVRRLGG